MSGAIPHMVVVISHDRDLLNNAVNSIVHLDQKKLTYYRGGYDQFERQTRARPTSCQTKMRAKTGGAAQAHGGLRRALPRQGVQGQAGAVAPEGAGEDGTVAAVDRRPCPAASLSRRRRSASPRPSSRSRASRSATRPASRCSPASPQDRRRRPHRAARRERQRQVDLRQAARRPACARRRARCTLAPNLNIGFFAQHQLDDLVPGDSAVEHVRKLMPDAPEAKVRARVAQMGLADGKDGHGRREDLSGGEKARLLMGLATFHAPEPADPRRADQPSRHRQPRGAGPTRSTISRAPSS